MKARRILLTVSLLLLTLTSFATGAGKYAWSDSVATQALNPTELSLQGVLDSLGYSINVATDAISMPIFTVPAGLTRLATTLKYVGASSGSGVGLYPAGSSTTPTELFAPGTTAPASTNVTLSESAQIGLYLGPTLYDDTWYSEPVLNWDAFDHIKVFPAGANAYVLCWEDLPDGGDQDFNDLILELCFTNPDALQLSFTGETFYLFCTEDFVCFDVIATGGTGMLTLSLVEDGVPTVVATGYSPLSYQHCFLPWPVDSIHTFSFQVEDEAAEIVQDSFAIEIKMQSRPVLTVDPAYIDTMICDIDSICFDVVSATDADGDDIVFSLLEGEGVIDSITGEICFLPDAVDSADYLFVVQAADSCCESFMGPPLAPSGCQRDTVIVTVKIAPRAEISTIDDTTIFLCIPQEICFDVTAAIDGVPTEVFQDCGTGMLANNQLCFTPDTAGIYFFCFYATDFCGTVRDTVAVTVILNEPPVAFAGDDTTFHCATGEVCWPAYCSDVDGNLTSCQLVAGSGVYGDSTICFTPPGTGIYQFVLEAIDSCGATHRDTVVVEITTGNPPIAFVGDSTSALCDPQQICIPAWCDDPDNDLVSCVLLTAPVGASFDGSQICYTPDSSGTYMFVLQATDACGGSDTDTGYIIVEINTGPQVNPGGGIFVLCEPDTICVPANVFDPDGDHTVTSEMGQVFNNNLICLYSGDQEGSQQFVFDVIATDTCSHADTAQYIIDLTLNMIPVIEPPILEPDTVCETVELCFDMDAIDSVMVDLVWNLLSGIGSIDAVTGEVCFTPDTSGTYTWLVTVVDSCGVADTALIEWPIYIIPPPTPVITPADGDTQVCYGVAVGEVCVDVTYDDTQAVTDITVTPSHPSIAWSFNWGGGVGELCFTPLVDQTETYSFTFELTDICNIVAASVYNHTVTFIDCDSSTCLTLEIEQTECVVLGSIVTVDFTISEDWMPIGGYDLLITYDVTGFTFLSASIGPAISGWEYFTYREVPFSGCGGTCPAGLVRLVSIADINNGANHPPPEQFLPDGVVATMSFRVTSNTSFAGLVYPVKFYWLDCGDNGFSTVSGDTFLVDRIIYDPEMVVWDEMDEINYPETNRLPGVGVPDSCLVGDKVKPLRCITFYNGSICIVHNDSIDARGDINLNGLAYEIADAVLFTNYFLRGITVFTISVHGQIAATDINNDGLTLTIGDLIYLLRIITGDALPVPKLSPYSEQAELVVVHDGSATRLATSSTSDLGGVFLKIRLGDAAATEVVKSLTIDEMGFDCAVNGDMLHVVIYSDKQGAAIPAGRTDLFTIANGIDCEIVHAEAAGYYGNMISLKVESPSLPSGFQLSQNYPNPFNPETEISLSLPQPSDWSLTIYNVNGQVVKRFEGTSAAGEVHVYWDATDDCGRPVATGIYFYRMDAGDFTDTKKMLLVK
ncbi:MAG: T9SS type A sorting domain-containing protein [candidate division Zixibacteria bacterium]|nr:T9SS type A sorting domain-containing protein [candidate division Zixibacteria bacterium]